MERRLFLKLGGSAALGSALAACGCGGGNDHTNSNPPPEPARLKVALGWNQLALDATRATRLSAPQAARALAIVHTAMYDAWAAYDANALATQSGAQLRQAASERTPANQLRAFSYAAYTALLDQFPNQRASFDAYMATLAYPLADGNSNSGALPAQVGALAAQAVINHAHNDGANQLGTLTPSGAPFADYSGYVASNAPLIVAQATPPGAIAYPDRWQALIYTDATGVTRTQSFLLPFWGQLTPFALTTGAQFRPGPAATLGTPLFREQAQFMVQTQCMLNETQKAMVDYWAGGTAGELPTGYWSQFARIVSARDQHDESADIKLFFALSNALFDASIAAWDAKRAYDSARPITAIRYLLCDTTITGFGFDGSLGSLRQITGASWMPYQLPTSPTLPFPDHVSGHSTLSAASAQVLSLFTGSDNFGHSVTIAPASMLFDPRLPSAPITFRWDTFSSAAREAGASRVFGGIHFPSADVMGRSLGEQVANAVFARAQRYWMGTS
ncbi:MAG: DUF6851 domain-containing protein [Massilia sp.]